MTNKMAMQYTQTTKREKPISTEKATCPQHPNTFNSALSLLKPNKALACLGKKNSLLIVKIRNNKGLKRITNR
jgi:hypothetical protein